MSSEEVTAPVDAPQAAEASDAKPASSRTRPSSTVAGEQPKKKIARASTSGGAKKSNGSGSSAAAKKSAESKSFKYGDVVLARLKGFPPWPARIANPEDIPAKVKAARPNAGRPMGATTKQSTHVVQYFPAGDFSWLHIRDLEHLSPKEITDFLSSSHRRTSGDLKHGYEIAQDPTEWDAEQKEINEERENAANQVDELEDDDDEEADTSATKRKKATKEKSKKRSKVSKAEVEDEEDAPAPKATKAKADKSKKPAAKVEAAPADDDPNSSDPECVKVKDWRHKLQRAFLGKAPPTADEMPTYDTLFKTIEDYKNITIEALTYSKIGKVMKKIGALTNVARDDEFHITERANKLMNDWSNVVDPSKTEANGNGNGEAAKQTAAEGAEPEQKEADPAVNGTGEGEGAGEKTEVEPTTA